MRVRNCVAKRGIHYYRTKINGGKSRFDNGDPLFVHQEDYPRLAGKGHVAAVEDEFRDVIEAEIEHSEVFPVTGSEIWVFGDGPTANSAKTRMPSTAISFGVNRCFMPALSLVPTYYVAMDDDMIMAEHDIIRDLKSAKKFTKRGNHRAGKLEWSDLMLFDSLGETGFSESILEVYHGKTSAYIALQLATQCGRKEAAEGTLEIHLAGIDLAVLESPMGPITHHYGHGNYHSVLFTRMLTSIRYGLNHLNQRKIKWVNHSQLLQSRIEDLMEGGYGRRGF